MITEKIKQFAKYSGLAGLITIAGCATTSTATTNTSQPASTSYNLKSIYTVNGEPRQLTFDYSISDCTKRTTQEDVKVNIDGAERTEKQTFLYEECAKVEGKPQVIIKKDLTTGNILSVTFKGYDATFSYANPSQGALGTEADVKR